MKIIFFFVAITLLFTVDASEDLEIYPGINFAISPKQVRSPKSPNSLYSTFLEQNWLPQLPLQSIPISGYDRTRKKDQEYIYSIPERLREFQQIINSHRNQFKRERDKNYYNRNDRLTQAEDIYEAYKSLQNADERYDRYQLRYPSTQQILDDVRPYPHDDDFTFHDDDVEEFERNGDGNGDRKNEEASGKGELRYEKVSDDVSEFAYTPLNPRFFENALYTEPRTPQQTEEDYVESNGNNEYSDANINNEEKIFVKPRYDDVFTLQHPTNDRQNLEQHTDNAVEVVAVKPHFQDKDTAGVYIIAVVAGISAAATVGLIAFGIGWYNLQKHVKNASDVEYPAYGVTGPNKDVSPSGDRRLAQSAQMYHYQHQKQQIIAMESRATATDRHGSLSEADSDEENEEGDYTVYECPGLAPTGEMEVKNPLFQDDPTPAQTPSVQTNGENVQKK